MTAIEIVEPGGPEVLKPTERPRPEPELGEILVKVAAAGVNRPDCMQRAGGYAPPPGASDIPGLEVAGSIVALGDGVAEWNLGDEICALVSGGGYAEYCVVPAPQALPLPRDFDMTRAAAVPETYFTVWTNVFERGRLDGGERFLIHGGASGIGTTAIQLGVAFGARVFATAGTAEKCAVCEELGAERAINYREEDFVAVIGELTGGEGVDLIVDMVGGDYLERNLAALAIEGRLVQIALQHGTSAEINVLPLMVKRLTFTGSTLRPRTVEQKAAIATALLENVWPLLNEGRVGPVMDSTFPLAEAAQAHARMESGAHIGKIVLTV
ncbi:MAG: NAD(P)H-quinone oxidoreductase [Alphaproteobacteria bacterium]